MMDPNAASLDPDRTYTAAEVVQILNDSRGACLRRAELDIITQPQSVGWTDGLIDVACRFGVVDEYVNTPAAKAVEII